MGNYRADFFKEVFSSRKWSSYESVSGHGSETQSTRAIVEALPGLLQRLDIRSMLDVPCGDFHWMKDVSLGVTSYIGADIVPELVEQNRGNYGRPDVRFEHLDLVHDELPAVDMIFVRDCFIHFTNELIFESLRNIIRSPIRYLCVTHDSCAARYPAGTNVDLERAVEGVNHEYRPINFVMPPFGFPPPVDQIPDGPFWNDFKVMAVWPAAAIREVLAR